MTHSYIPISGSHSKCPVCGTTKVDSNRKYYYQKGSNKPVAQEPDCKPSVEFTYPEPLTEIQKAKLYTP